MILWQAPARKATEASKGRPVQNHKDFDFSKIRRVRASETNVDGVGLYDWLKAYAQGTKFRYISDGNPATISIPESKQELIQSSKFQDKKIITY